MGNLILAKVIRAAAVKAGIRKRIGWHTFRHSFSTLLVGNGENVKVVQELMRQASARCALEIYSQARAMEKRGRMSGLSKCFARRPSRVLRFRQSRQNV